MGIWCCQGQGRLVQYRHSPYIVGVLLKRQETNMHKRRMVKVLVALFLSGAVAMWVHLDESRKGALGKEEFLKREAIRFDKYLAHPPIAVVISAICLGMIMFGLYELLCYAVARTIDGKKRQSD